MIESKYRIKFELPTLNHQHLSTLCGPSNQNLQVIEHYFDVEICNRDEQFVVQGEKHACDQAKQAVLSLYEKSAKQDIIGNPEIEGLLHNLEASAATEQAPVFQTPNGIIKPRTLNQNLYMQALQRYDINFGIGPAGTGKTFLAVAAAVHALERDEIERIILVRPAVEAGESLGFLPGDLSDKVDPYLRPLYDGLHHMLGAGRVQRLIEKEVIEIAPLAYMRGRTLSNAYIILDESQNTTREQMQMFLTRIGFGAKTVITGDPSQIDLPRKISSGLVHAMQILQPIELIHFTHFAATDVVRHPLVQRIIEAYARDQ